MRHEEDSRLPGDYVRQLSATSGDVTLVGVVHDHPASLYRTRCVVEQTDPDVLALELPELAVPLFTEYAQDSTVPPRFGGEMSTAIQAADTDRVEGIDGPAIGFVGTLLQRLVAGDQSLETARAVVRSFGSVTKHAISCRLGALITRTTSVTVEVDSPVPHDCDWDDDPEVQASDEQTYVRRAQTVMNAFETSGASPVRKSAREDYMADQLTRLRQAGDVVAVVGIGHLDELEARLDGR